ncbi:two component sensor histidine kinase [Gluconobacter thailandicus F149-1 = NBRC 100600]|uniref:histidine kinase n=1 Tax=Gluconobacter thailandicus NBRC 3257 TaxID=1381097 RepID=A0ABQ0IT33_GLUTH|nr:ATP-binding protein [Gluconobacter thailandicus]AFW01687.1 sensory transduction protein kinase [Gluconobacter oxydans H24]ANQ42695.1 hybrid sensor histidine kinase/response regulator [Gluconobacter oxydans]GAN90725.1 two component sensor histidine kinase [Gluconobacter frateurii M-2]KXV52370.1 histidine kinase [Gluconobacter thailandicus]GAC87659.1 sensory transduction protein kinase [Gluconobacter thailandicus NBRC 3255]
MLPSDLRNPSGATETARVLLVEPDDTHAQRIWRVLLKEGFAVTCLGSGEAALGMVEDLMPDLVVVCSELPGMTGGQLARRLRLDALTRTIPILMLTEDASPGVEREGLESGADAYISKSAHPDLLVLRMRALLREGPELLQVDEASRLRRARIVIVNSPRDEDEDEDIPDDAPETTLGELLWRDGHTVTSIERSDDLIEGGWLRGADGPDCLVLELGSGEEDLKFCRLLDARRQAVLEAGGIPFRTLGIVEASRFRRQSSGEFFEAGIDDLVPSDIAIEALAMRIRTLAQRRMAQDEFRQQEIERQQNALTLEAARAKAEMAEALAQANMELARTNEQLIQAQSKLVQTAKMASLGELVAGIAHEINNPLAFTIAHADTVERTLKRLQTMGGPEEGAPLMQKGISRLESMKLGLQRIQNLVLSLRRFSRLDESSFQTVDVPGALDTALALLGHKLGPDIIIEKDLQAPAHLVCQPAFLNQVVMNIISNAADALADMSPEGGPVEGRIVITSRLENGRYDMTISDDGPGLPVELRNRVFDPFFTTKPVGTGTGLGLAIAYSVMEAHDGTIEITDANLPDGRGIGACFRLSLPVTMTEEGPVATGRPV